MHIWHLTEGLQVLTISLAALNRALRVITFHNTVQGGAGCYTSVLCDLLCCTALPDEV